MMYKDRLDESAEWRYYGADDSMNDDKKDMECQ